MLAEGRDLLDEYCYWYPASDVVVTDTWVVYSPQQAPFSPLNSNTRKDGVENLPGPRKTLLQWRSHWRVKRRVPRLVKIARVATRPRNSSPDHHEELAKSQTIGTAYV